MQNNRNILVVGGVGFIGLYMMLVLWDVGYNVIIYDNFFIGYEDVCFGVFIICGEFLD